MMARHARDGRVAWIGLRPERRGGMREAAEAELTEAGLRGDHARPGKRALTLIQAEHLPVIAALAGRESAPPELMRRNIVVSGLNLIAFRKAQLSIGDAVIEITGPAHPCSRMEEALGPGGYTAMRNHGGVCAAVITPGRIRIGDPVRPVRMET